MSKPSTNSCKVLHYLVEQQNVGYNIVAIVAGYVERGTAVGVDSIGLL